MIPPVKTVIPDKVTPDSILKKVAVYKQYSCSVTFFQQDRNTRPAVNGSTPFFSKPQTLTARFNKHVNRSPKPSIEK
jgi:hypothetical protein